MEEILHHLGWLKPYKEWDNHHPWWCRILSMNSITANFEDLSGRNQKQTTEIHQHGRNCCSATNAFGQFVPSERFPGLESSGKDPSPKYVQEVLIILMMVQKSVALSDSQKKIQEKDPTQLLLQSNQKKNKAFVLRTFKSRPIIGAADSVETISLLVDSLSYVRGMRTPTPRFPYQGFIQIFFPLVLGGYFTRRVPLNKLR